LGAAPKTKEVRVLGMNDSKVNFNPVKAFFTTEKREILLFGVLLGLIVVLSYFKLLNLGRAFFALFPFFIAIRLLVFQKHVTASAILMLIAGCLFLSSGFLFEYLVNMPFPEILFLNQISGGLFTIALGLTMITFVTAMLKIFRSGLPSKFRFPWPVGLMFLVFFACGIVLVWVGGFSVISGLRYL
jgi:hypothetical protein